MKTCTRCGEQRPLTDYYTDKRNRDGKYGNCRFLLRGNHQAIQDGEP